MYDSNRPKMQEVSGGVYEQKKKILKRMENAVKVTKEALKHMKKPR